MTDLMRGINLNVLQKKLKPYKKVSLDFLAQDLQVTKTEMINLLAELILEEKIQGQIDQTTGFLELETASSESTFEKYKGLQQWSRAVLDIHA